MDPIVSLLEYLNTGTVDVFWKMLRWKADVSPGYTDFPMPMRMFGVTGAVSLAGRLTGIVYANFTDSFAERVAERILGDTPPLSMPAVNDVVGELTNMISGNIKSRMSDQGYSCRLSIPAVMRGAPMLIDTKTVPIKIGNVFSFPGTDETLTVHFFARLDSDSI